MLWAFYKGRRVFEVFERNDGYIAVDLPEIYFSEFEDWAPHQKRAMNFVKGKVLDVGCGAGRHSLYLQGKGFDVIGIDASPLAIKICRLRGVKKAQLMSIEKITDEYYLKMNILLLMMTGKINKPYEGCKSPMSKISRDFI